MYFKSRADAGRQLAKQLTPFANQNIAVVALNEGGVIVGAQIAIAVHANLMLLATTIASVQAVDRMHLLGDELHVLSVPENFMNTNHYYEDNAVPDQDGLFKVMQNISLGWKNKK